MKNKGDILASLLKDYNDCCTFLHNTRERHIAEKIMNEGFIFESQLPRSADRVNPKESVEITYFFLERKEYGDYTIIIAIPRMICQKYSEIALLKDISFEEVISITEPRYGENDEFVFTLSPRHVLGFFDINSMLFKKNRLWDPAFDNCPAKPGMNDKESL